MLPRTCFFQMSVNYRGTKMQMLTGNKRIQSQGTKTGEPLWQLPHHIVWRLLSGGNLEVGDNFPVGLREKQSKTMHKACASIGILEKEFLVGHHVDWRTGSAPEAQASPERNLQSVHCSTNNFCKRATMCRLFRFADMVKTNEPGAAGIFSSTFCTFSAPCCVTQVLDCRDRRQLAQQRLCSPALRFVRLTRSPEAVTRYIIGGG